MKKYVDINAIIKTMRHWKEYVKTSDLIQTFSNMPGVDVIEVVRCKDCKYYEEDGVCNAHSEYEDKYTRGHLVTMDGDDFCSIGVRKND